MTTPRLTITNLRKSFAGRSVVNDVSLTVRPGQVTCLLGPSGCGKSTTLRAVAGVEQPDSGTIHVDGQLVCDGVSSVPPEARSIGLMFQDFALFPHLTVAANVAFGLQSSRADRDARVSALLDKVGMSRHAARYPHELSGGEQQRVALARALAPKPKVMLMDEPFSGLDDRLRDDIGVFHRHSMAAGLNDLHLRFRHNLRQQRDKLLCRCAVILRPKQDRDIRPPRAQHRTGKKILRLGPKFANFGNHPPVRHKRLNHFDHASQQGFFVFDVALLFG